MSPRHPAGAHGAPDPSCRPAGARSAPAPSCHPAGAHGAPAPFCHPAGASAASECRDLLSLHWGRLRCREGRPRHSRRLRRRSCGVTCPDSSATQRRSRGGTFPDSSATQRCSCGVTCPSSSAPQRRSWWVTVTVHVTRRRSRGGTSRHRLLRRRSCGATALRQVVRQHSSAVTVPGGRHPSASESHPTLRSIHPAFFASINRSLRHRGHRLSCFSRAIAAPTFVVCSK